jgi:hypothetical protein
MMTLLDHDALMRPQINMNGMTWGQHVEKRTKAMRHVADLIEALADLHPHGRDYPGDPDACQRDMAIHNERMGNLHRLHSELYEEAVLIQKGVGA